MRFDGDVGVRWFSVESGEDFAIWAAGEEDVQKCDGVIFFHLPHKLDTRMDGVQAVIEVNCSVSGCAVSQARATILEETPDVIHVDGDETGDGEALLTSYFNSFFHGENHPDLADRHHERQTDGTAVVLGMIPFVEEEVGG